MRERTESVSRQRESTEYVCAPLSTVLDRGAWSHRASVRVCVDVAFGFGLLPHKARAEMRKRKMELKRQKRPIFMLKFNFARLR